MQEFKMSMRTAINNKPIEMDPRHEPTFPLSWRWMVPLWLISAVLLVLVNQYRNGPATLADELGYLGVARWLAGVGQLPNMFTASFYHFGYSFLIAPAFWLGTNPVDAYRWAMVINCIIAATVAPLSYIFARKAFGVSHKMAAFLAGIAMLYPANAAQTNFAWSENALPALLLCWAIILFLVHEKPSPTKLVCVALVSVALFFVHPRMLGIEFVTLAYLVVAAVTCKSGRRWYVVGCVVLLLAHALVAHELSHVRHLEYEITSGSVTSFLHILSHVLSKGIMVPAASAGQVTYLSYGSEGLIVIGIMALILLSVSKYTSLRTEHSIARSFFVNPTVILTAGIASIFAASAITMSSGARVDHWLYGRYVDAASPILLIAGTLTALDRRQIRRLAPWLVMTLCFAITLWFTFAAVTIPGSVVYNNIPTLAPLIRALQSFAGAKHIAFAVVMLLVLAPALLWAAAGRRAVAPIIAVYVLISIITVVEWPRNLVGHDAYPAPIKAVRTELDHKDLLGSKILVYRDSFSEPNFVIMFYRMQYFLDRNQIVVVKNPPSSSEACPRIGTQEDLVAGPGAVEEPIPMAKKVVFWIPKSANGSIPCT